jgi:hypothetical protein
MNTEIKILKITLTYIERIIHHDPVVFNSGSKMVPLT